MKYVIDDFIGKNVTITFKPFTDKFTGDRIEDLTLSGKVDISTEYSIYGIGKQYVIEKNNAIIFTFSKSMVKKVEVENDK